MVLVIVSVVVPMAEYTVSAEYAVPVEKLRESAQIN